MFDGSDYVISDLSIETNNNETTILSDNEQISFIGTWSPHSTGAWVGMDKEEFHRMYTEKKIANAILYAKELKDRYSVLWLYYDMFGAEVEANA